MENKLENVTVSPKEEIEQLLIDKASILEAIKPYQEQYGEIMKRIEFLVLQQEELNRKTKENLKEE